MAETMSKTAEECRAGNNFYPFTRLGGTKKEWLQLKRTIDIGISEGFDSEIANAMSSKIEEMFREE